MANTLEERILKAQEEERQREKILTKWGTKTGSVPLMKYVFSHAYYSSDEKIEKTYDYIYSKMENDGYSKDEIKRFLEKNKDILDVEEERLKNIFGMFKSKEQADLVFYNCPRVFTRKIPLNKFYTSIRELDDEFTVGKFDMKAKSESKPNDTKTVSKEQLDETYTFIVNKFLNDGFSEEQARKFIDENLDLLMVPTKKIMCELSVLSIVSLDDKVFYENTDLISSMPPITRVYGAVKSSQNRSIQCVADIRRHLAKKPSETTKYDGALTKEKLLLFYQNYKNRFDKKVKSREENRVL